MPRPLAEQVVVVTGASSGIGRAAALEFASRGAAVVLASRNAAALWEVDREIQAQGGRSYVSITDVSDWEQVDRLAGRAVAHFGRIDTWVNNAGIAIYARVDELTPEEMERVISVNLLGAMYGCRAAVEQMKRQGGEGGIINIASVLAARSVPLQSAYCASKHGLKGFGEALRMELEADEMPISVTTILPSSINTPFFNHARSKMGVKPMPIPPVYEPSAVVEAILHAADHPQREVVVGGSGKLLTFAQRLNPRLVDRVMVMGRTGEKQQQTNEPDDLRDNVDAPLSEGGSVTGDFGDGAKKSSFYTRVFEEHPVRKNLVAAAGAIGAMALIRRAGRP